MRMIECPDCQLVARPAVFEESCAGECWCPRCGTAFSVEDDEYEEGDEEDE